MSISASSGATAQTKRARSQEALPGIADRPQPDRLEAGDPGAAHAPAHGGRIAVVLKGWPRLSETFVAQELALLEEKGVSFEIWSLRHPTDVKRRPLHDRVRAPVRYLQEYLRNAPLRTLRGLFWGLGQRRFWPVLGIWVRDFARDRTINRVRRLGQGLTLARELPSDVTGLYAHFLHTPASVTRYAAALRGLPWGFSAHAKDIWTSPDWELGEKIADARFGATCTAYGAEKLRSLSAEPQRISLVYHGLERKRFPEPPLRTEAAAAAAGSERPFEMLSVGRLVEKKGFDRLIDALALLPEDLDWRWTHLGGGPMRIALAARAAERDRDGRIAARIAWRGPADQSEVIAAMRRSDLFVLPSRIAESGDRDGLPNVLMEAASQTLAILSTPVAAIPEFIRDGREGVLSQDDPTALARAMTGLARDPKQRLDLGRAAAARLAARFDAGPGVETLRGLLQDHLGAEVQTAEAEAEAAPPHGIGAPSERPEPLAPARRSAVGADRRRAG